MCYVYVMSFLDILQVCVHCVILLRGRKHTLYSCSVCEYVFYDIIQQIS